MNTLLRLYKQVKGRFPSPLPQGVTDFNAWCDDIKATYTLPTQSDDDIRFCFASGIIRFNETVCYKSKYHFVKYIRAGAAKQVAGYAFSEIKHKQHQAQLAAQAKAQAEASTGASDAPQVQGV